MIDFEDDEDETIETINKIDEFVSLAKDSNIFNKPKMLIMDAFTSRDSVIKVDYPKIKQGALNNAHGDWYEWILAIECWNMFVRKEVDYLALVLPNIRQFDVSRLYQSDLQDLILDLRQKVKQFTKASLITSNPDFVIIDTYGMDLSDTAFNEISKIDAGTIEHLASAYKDFIGKCNFDAIIGYISVKTSLRPDRRLQIPHEGSLMKAIYAHMQTRKWIIQPKGLKYYAVSTRIGDSDRNGLATVATHSITTVSELPIPAVDGVFQCSSISDVRKNFKEMLIFTKPT